MLALGIISESFRVFHEWKDKESLFQTIVFYASVIPQIRGLVGEIDDFLRDEKLKISRAERVRLHNIRNSYVLLVNTLENWNTGKESFSLEEHRTHLSLINGYYGEIFRHIQSLRNLGRALQSGIFNKYIDEYLKGSIFKAPNEFIQVYMGWKKSTGTLRKMQEVQESTNDNLSPSSE